MPSFLLVSHQETSLLIAELGQVNKYQMNQWRLAKIRKAQIDAMEPESLTRRSYACFETNAFSGWLIGQD